MSYDCTDRTPESMLQMYHAEAHASEIARMILIEAHQRCAVTPPGRRITMGTAANDSSSAARSSPISSRPQASMAAGSPGSDGLNGGGFDATGWAIPAAKSGSF